MKEDRTLDLTDANRTLSRVVRKAGPFMNIPCCCNVRNNTKAVDTARAFLRQYRDIRFGLLHAVLAVQSGHPVADALSLSTGWIN